MKALFFLPLPTINYFPRATLSPQDQAAIKARLAQHNCFYVAGRSVKDRGDALYFSTELKGVVMLVEVTIMGASCQGVVKTANPSLAPCVLEAVRDLLTTS